MPLPIEQLFAFGAAATIEETERWTGQRFDPRAAGTRLVGSRVLVVRDRTPNKEGSIFIPEAVQDRNPMGSGTVIGVGHTVGHGFATYPGELGFAHTNPAATSRDFLGLRVYFEMYAGTAFRSSLQDSEWKADLLILLTKDILGVDVLNSPRWQTP